MSTAASSTNPRGQATPIMPVPQNHKIARVWPKILDIILKNNNLPKLSSIGCFRYGPKLQITVLILLDTANLSDKRIKSNVDRIRELLDSYDLTKVDIVVRTGGICLGADVASVGQLDFDIFETPAIVGQSLAHKSNTRVAGTLGAFVEVKIKGTWRTMALTCFHVVSEPALQQEMLDYWKRNKMNPRSLKSPRQVLEDWNDHGVKPNDENRGMLQVNHPATASLTKAKEVMEEQLEFQFSSNRLQALLDKDEKGEGEFLRRDQKADLNFGKDLMKKIAQCKKFNNGGHADFGIVWAASGLKAAHNSTRGFEWADNKGTHIEKVTLMSEIDWALIIPPKHRIPKVPTPYPKNPERTRFHDTANRSAFPKDLGGKRVCMFGQRGTLQFGIIHSLITAATVKGFEPVLKGDLEEKVRKSLDWVVTGIPTTDKKKKAVQNSSREKKDSDEEHEKYFWKSFSEGGDSGALVYLDENPQDRVLVGMVRSGTYPQPYWTYVTPIEYIYQDIKARTGAEDIRLKV